MSKNFEERLEKVEGGLFELVGRMKRLEEMIVGRSDCASADVDETTGLEGTGVEGRLSRVEGAVQKVGDVATAVQMQLEEYRQEHRLSCPTPQEQAEGAYSTVLSKAGKREARKLAGTEMGGSADGAVGARVWGLGAVAERGVGSDSGGVDCGEVVGVESAEGLGLVGKRVITKWEGKKVMVVGDSIARGVADRLVEQHGDRVGKISIGGARIETAREEVLGMKEELAGKHVVVLAGTNNLRSEGSEVILGRYRRILEDCKGRRCKLSVVGILDRGDLSEFLESKRFGINSCLKKMCLEFGVGFVNVKVDRYLGRDGLHLGVYGQKVVARAINFEIKNSLN